MHAPEARKKAMATKHGLTDADRAAIAKEGLGKSVVEQKAICAKHGIARSSLVNWRRKYLDNGGRPATKAPHEYQTRPLTSEQARLVAAYQASGEPLATWAKSHSMPESSLRGLVFRSQGRSREKAKRPPVSSKPARKTTDKERKEIIIAANGYPSDAEAYRRLGLKYSDVTLISKWRHTYNMPRRRGKAPPPPTPGARRAFSEEFKRKVVERTKTESIDAVSAATGVTQSVIYAWRKQAGLRKRPPYQIRGQAPAPLEPSGLSPDDQALLEGHDQVRTRDKNLLEKVRKLEKENLWLKTNLAYAIDGGFLQLFDVTQMFGKKGQ